MSIAAPGHRVLIHTLHTFPTLKYCDIADRLRTCIALEVCAHARS